MEESSTFCGCTSGRAPEVSRSTGLSTRHCRSSLLRMLTPEDATAGRSSCRCPQQVQGNSLDSGLGDISQDKQMDGPLVAGCDTGQKWMSSSVFSSISGEEQKSLQRTIRKYHWELNILFESVIYFTQWGLCLPHLYHIFLRHSPMDNPGHSA